MRWAKLVIPLVVHSASKVRLRAAAAMEMGLPMLLTQQADVAAAIEPVMASVSPERALSDQRYAQDAGEMDQLICSSS